MDIKQYNDCSRIVRYNRKYDIIEILMGVYLQYIRNVPDISTTSVTSMLS